jgi:hypothetical protein
MQDFNHFKQPTRSNTLSQYTQAAHNKLNDTQLNCLKWLAERYDHCEAGFYHDASKGSFLMDSVMSGGKGSKEVLTQYLYILYKVKNNTAAYPSLQVQASKASKLIALEAGKHPWMYEMLNQIRCDYTSFQEIIKEIEDLSKEKTSTLEKNAKNSPRP